MQQSFAMRLRKLRADYKALTTQPNEVDEVWYNGCYSRFVYPVITNEHVPLEWRYDLNPETNPRLMERMGVNAVFNAGAIEMNGKICLVCRVEGYDRKSFFAVAESVSGVDNFVFRRYPVVIPQLADKDTNVYDMRVVKHADGWIYGLFCTERKDPAAGKGDTSSAVAACGIVRTKDLDEWERLPDLKTPSPQQRNVVLHPEFVDGKYAFYTRPQDGFIDAGSGGGIGWGLADDIENAVLKEEKIVDEKVYHTIKEVKNGCGAPVIKTPEGWLHIAHGVRNTAAGLRYVLYAFMTALDNPARVIYNPGGYFLAPYESERVGDVSNVVFCNGAVARSDGSLLIYYASSDTRMHVAMSSVDALLDWVKHTPADPLYSSDCVQQRIALIKRNEAL